MKPRTAWIRPTTATTTPEARAATNMEKLSPPIGKYDDDEYKYFKIFIRHTMPSYMAPTHDIIKVQSHVLKLIEIVLKTENDKDEISCKLANVLASIFSYTQHMNDIEPCQSSSLLNNKLHKFRNIRLHAAELINSIEKMSLAYDKTVLHSHSQLIWRDFQTQVYNVTHSIWEMSDFNDIHDLLSLKIQNTCHGRIMIRKQHLIMNNSYMKMAYQNNPIYPWKYYWNPISTDIIEFMSPHIKLGESYSMSEILQQFNEVIKENIYGKNQDEDKIKTEVSKLFQLEEKDFNLRDLRSLQYPLLSHLYTLPYEDIWNEKYLKVYHQKEENRPTNKRGSSTPPPEESTSKHHKVLQTELTDEVLLQIANGD